MHREHLPQFTSLIVSLARLTALVRDNFLVQKLNQSISSIVEVFLGSSEGDNNVAQYIHLGKIKITITEVLSVLEYTEHFHLTPVGPLLQVRKAVLSFYAVLLTGREKQKPVKKFLSQKKGEPQFHNQSSSDSSLSVNQKKILSFIQAFPNARTKDIVDKFSMLSDRTVKRNLRELISSGLVIKRAENRAVYYSSPAGD